jgi:hypothetical protein
MAILPVAQRGGPATPFQLATRPPIEREPLDPSEEADEALDEEGYRE